MIKKLTLASLLASGTLFGDTIIGGEVSLGIYSHSPSGTASYTLPYSTFNSAIDLENDFGWDDERDIVLKAYFEHPVPFIPNAKFSYSNFNQSGEGSVSSFSWGEIIDLDGIIDTSVALQMYDATAYYELLDNVVEIDAGLTFRYLNGDVTVIPIADFDLPASIFSSSAALPSQVTDLDLWIPMLYGKARFNIPTTDISLQLEANAVSYQETNFYDYEISARYTLLMGLGIEAGYKSMHLDSEDLSDGLIVDMDISGLYASVVWDF